MRMSQSLDGLGEEAGPRRSLVLDRRARGWSSQSERASALSGAEAIEALLLLVAKGAIKLLERGLHGLHRAQHCIEPLLHRLQAADRRERPIGGAIRVQQIDRLGGGIL